VTNASIDYMQPSWNLRTSPARTSWIDDKLFGKPCVFFSTTQYKARLPTISVYPDGGEPGKEYHRVRIPLTHFNNYEMRYVNSDHAGKQVLLLLARPGIDDELASQFKVVPEPNDWLWRSADKTWYTNDYNQQKYFVNVAVLHGISTEGCKWDMVPHQ